MRSWNRNGQLYNAKASHHGGPTGESMSSDSVANVQEIRSMVARRGAMAQAVP